MSGVDGLDLALGIVWLLVLLAGAWAVVVFLQQLRLKREHLRRAAMLDAAVRAQAIAEGIPARGVTVRGASRDRSLPGKARRRQRRL